MAAMMAATWVEHVGAMWTLTDWPSLRLGLVNSDECAFGEMGFRWSEVQILSARPTEKPLSNLGEGLFGALFQAAALILGVTLGVTGNVNDPLQCVSTTRKRAAKQTRPAQTKLAGAFLGVAGSYEPRESATEREVSGQRFSALICATRHDLPATCVQQRPRGPIWCGTQLEAPSRVQPASAGRVT
jgi:hypothetical protein